MCGSRSRKSKMRCFAGLDAGAEGRPGRGGQRRVDGAQAVVAAPLRERLQVGQLPRRHQTVRQDGILPVEADDHEPLDPGLRPGSAAQDAPQGAERPGEERDDGEDHRDEDDQERREEGEAGPGADVGVGGGRGRRRAPPRARAGPRCAVSSSRRSSPDAVGVDPTKRLLYPMRTVPTQPGPAAPGDTGCSHLFVGSTVACATASRSWSSPDCRARARP